MGLHVKYFYSHVLRILQLPLLKTVLNLLYPFFFLFLSFRVILIACTKAFDTTRCYRAQTLHKERFPHA